MSYFARRARIISPELQRHRQSRADYFAKLDALQGKSPPKPPEPPEPGPGEKCPTCGARLGRTTYGPFCLSGLHSD
ncbi:hypothetical protein DRW03_21180 [Corallococcus sp. H22C18031201]|nr:hypothetical protein DRW03_21180 [Corallococcus sp. H22C18031201]